MTDSPAQPTRWYQPVVDFGAKTWKHFAGFSAVIADVIAFVKLVQGEQELLTWIIAIGSLLILVALLIFVGWMDKNSASKPLLRNLARVLMLIVFVAGTVASVRIYQRNLERNAKFVILVLDFTGPDPENYEIRQDIVRQLKESLKPYESETEVIGDDTPVTEDDGSKAVEIGKSYRADLVLWGRYQIQDSVAKVTVHVENLTELSRRTIPVSEDYVEKSPTDHFQFQDKLYKQSGAIALFISGMTRYEVKDYVEAEKRITQALETGVWPDQLAPTPMLFFYRGYSRLENENYQGAVEDFNQVVELLFESTVSTAKRTSAKAYNNMGKAYQGLGQLDDAIASYQNAIASDSSYLTARHNLGIIYGNRGDYERAYAEFEKILSIDPQNVAAYNNIGVNLRRQGDLQGSLDMLNKALDIDRSYYLAYYNRGVTYEGLGQVEKAIEDYGEAIRLNPDYSKSYNNRGNLYIDLELYDLAIIDLEIAVHREPTYAVAHRNLGRAHGSVKEYEAAIIDFTNAIKHTPDDAWAYFFRGQTYIALHNREAAVKDFRTVLAKTSDEKLIKLVSEQLQKLGEQP